MKLKITKEVAEHIEIALPAYIEDPGFGFYKVYERNGQLRKLHLQYSTSNEPTEEPFYLDCELGPSGEREKTALINCITKNGDAEYCSAKGMKLITREQFNAQWKHVASLWHEWFLHHLNEPDATQAEQPKQAVAQEYDFETGV